MSNERPAPPSLTEMLHRYLQKRADAQAAGIADDKATGDVVPFEAVPVQPVEPRLAWDEALAAARHFNSALNTNLEAPPDWPALVSTHEPEMALAFAVGN